jgi:site-specific DNA recombinase
MRTLIYARFSSQLQNSRSIDDQVAVCRDRCEREGWHVVDVFTDYAISGAAGLDEAQRPGMNALLARVERGGVDQVLADTTSRIARDQGDAHHIRKLLDYHGARLFTLADGEIDAFKGAIKGLLDEQQRRELAHNIKRGQRGAVGEGRAPAGLAYGYRRANRLDDRGELVRGLREIDAAEAAIVVRIFEQYAAGASARTIALRLNREGVKGPRGRQWSASSIRGDRIRRNGMLRNRLYAGELVHNRTSKVADPRTRKTRIRPNPESDWIVEAVPALRIVGPELWESVQQQLAAREGTTPQRQQRPRRLLSGMLVCGCCGGPLTVISSDYWGCRRRREGSGCTNNRTIGTRRLEERVLQGLREGMLDPAVVAAYVKAYHREHGRRMADAARGRARIEKQLAESGTRIDRLVDAIARGADIEEVRAALAGARAQREAAQAELREIEDLPIVALHPRLTDEYRKNFDELGRLFEGAPDDASRDEAVRTLRSLIDRVVATPAKHGRGLDISVEGRLAAILALATGEPQPERAPAFVVERVKPIVRKHKLLRAKA